MTCTQKHCFVCSEDTTHLQSTPSATLLLKTIKNLGHACLRAAAKQGLIPGIGAMGPCCCHLSTATPGGGMTGTRPIPLPGAPMPACPRPPPGTLVGPSKPPPCTQQGKHASHEELLATSLTKSTKVCPRDQALHTEKERSGTE